MKLFSVFILDVAMAITQDRLYFFIDTLQENGFSCAEIHRLLVQRWGEDNVVSIRRIQQIAKQFQKENRVDHERKQGSGRPRTSKSEEHVETVRELIDENNRLSCNAISRLTGIDADAVNRILIRDLHKKSLCCKWLPHELRQQDKRKRVECCRFMLDRFSKRRSQDNVIVLDEKWVYFRDVPARENMRAWVDSTGDRPTYAKRTISDQKVLIILSSNYSKSMWYLEVLHDGGSIDAARYLQFLKNMVVAFGNKLPRWEIIVQHDNAKPHIARIVKEWLAAEHISLLQQPPYSPDTNLMDRFLFRNYETYRRGRDFANSQDVDESVRQFMDTITKQQLDKQLQNLLDHLQKVIDADGNYV